MKTFSETIARLAKALLLSAILHVPLAMAATSDDLFNTYFSNVLDGAPCYARTYGEDHLKQHPAQRVRKIEIDLSKSNTDGTPNTADRFELGFALMLAPESGWIGQTASCRTNDADFECYLNADGGMFRLVPQKGGGLRLETGEDGISLEGSGTDVDLSGTEGDDRVFDLVPSKAECKDASAYFEGGND